MKNYILALGLFLSFIAPSRGQITLQHTYGNDHNYLAEVVDLSLSGKKIAVVRIQFAANQPDTIFYYNLDYSLWKMIPCPAISGLMGNFSFDPTYSNISYSSETLFNLDSLLEVAVYYSGIRNNIYIINENGVLLDSFNAVNDLSYYRLQVHNINSSTFIATISTPNGLQVYSLPGTLPCDVCGGGLGLSKTEEKPTNLLSNPIPNPSKNEVKITFTLPDGADRGELTIYNTEGQKMKSYTVDNRFGFIMVDDSQFAPGMYYYNLTVNGQISSSQKMLVIK